MCASWALRWHALSLQLVGAAAHCARWRVRFRACCCTWHPTCTAPKPPAAMVPALRAARPCPRVHRGRTPAVWVFWCPAASGSAAVPPWAAAAPPASWADVNCAPSHTLSRLYPSQVHTNAVGSRYPPGALGPFPCDYPLICVGVWEKKTKNANANGRVKLKRKETIGRRTTLNSLLDNIFSLHMIYFLTEP